MKKRVITISREFGSGGHSIGKTVAETLGIGFYDHKLLEKIAEETGFILHRQKLLKALLKRKAA